MCKSRRSDTLAQKVTGLLASTNCAECNKDPYWKLSVMNVVNPGEGSVEITPRLGSCLQSIGSGSDGFQISS